MNGNGKLKLSFGGERNFLRNKKTMEIFRNVALAIKIVVKGVLFAAIIMSTGINTELAKLLLFIGR